MDTYAHFRVKKGHVLIHVEDSAVKIQIKGMSYETINIEVENCSTVDIQGNYKTLDKRHDD